MMLICRMLSPATLARLLAAESWGGADRPMPSGSCDSGMASPGRTGATRRADTGDGDALTPGERRAIGRDEPMTPA